MEFRPTRLEINLDNIEHNIKSIRKIVRPETLIMGVVKANAYGHGSIEIARTILKNGADRLAVSTLEEGIELRKAGIEVPILLLNFVPKEQLPMIIDYDLTASIYNLDLAEDLNQIAKKKNKIVNIHIKLDTGMNRIGFLPRKTSLDEIMKIHEMDNLNIEGIYSHLCRADESNKDFSNLQFEKFTWVVDELEKLGLDIAIKHISNSAGIIDLAEYNLDMVRAGIILYGHYPSDEVDKSRIDLKPALELKSRVSHVKEVKEGCGIGYGHKYIAEEAIKVATIPIGYGDGFTRLLSNKAMVSIGGENYPNIGNICMDQFMVKLPLDKNVEVGDEVILISHKLDGLRVEDLSEKIGTINYEVLCMLARRIPRVYMYQGEEIDRVDYLLNQNS